MIIHTFQWFNNFIISNIIIQSINYLKLLQMQKNENKGKQSNWNNQKAFLLQKIELYEITINQMKQRQQKIKRINQTLLNSLSSSQSGSNGIQQLLKQQSDEIARLHQKLSKKREQNITKTIRKNLQDQDYSRSEKKDQSQELKLIKQQNKELKKKIQQLKAEKNENEKILKSVYQKKIKDMIQNSTIIQKAKNTKGFVDNKYKQDSQKEINLLKNQCVFLKEKIKKLQNQDQSKHVSKVQTHMRSKADSLEINMSGYINFIKSNQQSINSQLLKKKSNNIFWYI